MLLFWRRTRRTVDRPGLLIQLHHGEPSGQGSMQLVHGEYECRISLHRAAGSANDRPQRLPGGESQLRAWKCRYLSKREPAHSAAGLADSCCEFGILLALRV